MEKILITGGAGYIGSVLTGHLLEKGYKVTVVDNLMYKQFSLLAWFANPNFDFIPGDIRDENLMKGLVERHDAILHLAAIVGMKACERNPELANSVNLQAIDLLNRLRSVNQKVIFPCTNSGYGTKTSRIHCTEETPLEPISLYGITKVQAEKELFDKPNVISLRLATVFGPSPRMRLDLLVNNLVYRAVRDGFLVIYEKDFRRNYIHITDVAGCFFFCLKNFEKMKDEVYNVGLDEVNYSKAELADKIREHISNLYIHYAEIGSDPDKRNYIVSNEKIRKMGFAAQHSLDEGIQQLIKLYRILPGGNFYNA